MEPAISMLGRAAALSHGDGIANFGVTITDCLAVVGLTQHELISAAGSELAEGQAYLVGSLSAGLGNAGSDVDIHVLRPGLTTKVGPYMHFANNVVVDVECFPLDWPTQIAEEASHCETTATPAGTVALAVPPDPVTSWDLVSRWLHALPLDNVTPPIFDKRQSACIQAVLVRNALDALLCYVTIARLADAANESASVRQYLWRTATRHFIEFCCRGAGDVTPNQKWLPARAHRLGIDQGEATSESSFYLATRQSCLLLPEALELTRLDPAADAKVINFAGQKRLLNRHGRLMNSWCGASGIVSELMADYDPAQLLQAVRRAELDMSVDADRLREALV